jgi:hypothetical protein
LLVITRSSALNQKVCSHNLEFFLYIKNQLANVDLPAAAACAAAAAETHQHWHHSQMMGLDDELTPRWDLKWQMHLTLTQIRMQMT